MLKQRALQLQQERDVLTASSAYNELRDAARNQLSELYNLSGKDAFDLGKKYDQWFQTAHEKLMSERLDTGNQQQIFLQMAQRQRAADLDVLARREYNQRQRFKKQVEDGLFANLVVDVKRDPFNDARREEAIGAFLQKIDELHQGEDTTARKKEVLLSIRTEALREMADQDPIKAKEYLEKWHDDLGDTYFELKRILKSKVSEKKIEAVAIDLESKFGSTVDGYRQAISFLERARNYRRYGLTLDESRKLRGEFRTRLSDKQSEENAAQAEGSRNELSAFVDTLYQQGDRTAARRLLDQSLWIRKYHPETLARLYKETESGTLKSDPAQKERLTMLVNTRPDELSDDDIWFSKKFSRVTAADKQAAQVRRDNLLKLEKKNSPLMSAYKRMQNEIRKLEFPGKNDAEKISNRVKAAGALQSWLENNPDAKPEQMESAFEAIVKPARVNRILNVLNYLAFASEGKGPEKKRLSAIRRMIRENRPISEEAVTKEVDFENWYQKLAQKVGLPSDVDLMPAGYDFRRMYEAGAKPTKNKAGQWMLPSAYKVK